jgi:cell volume regulation protein A
MGFGSLSGCFWSFVLNKLRGQKFNYILTIAMVFLIYVVSEGVVESSGALTLLFFGLLLVNSDSIFRKLGFREMFEIEISHLREFHEEITFLLKSFFFVYVGLITNISLNYLFIGLGASLMVLCSRLLVVRLYGYMVKLSVVESDIIKFSIANGLSTLVASRLPLIYDPKGLFIGDPGLYNNVCFVVVIVSVLISMFITPYVASRDIKLISKNVNSNM